MSSTSKIHDLYTEDLEKILWELQKQCTHLKKIQKVVIFYIFFTDGGNALIITTVSNSTMSTLMTILRHV